MCRCPAERGWGRPALHPPLLRADPLKGAPEAEKVLVGDTPEQTTNPELPRRVTTKKLARKPRLGEGPLTWQSLRAAPAQRLPGAGAGTL